MEAISQAADVSSLLSLCNTHIQDGELFTRQGLDREQRAQYVFTVMLEEKRTSSKIVRTVNYVLSRLTLFLQTVSEIIVDVLDVNDTPPKFEKDSYSEFVSENVPVGTIIAELRATDADSPANTDLVYLFGKNSDKGMCSGGKHKRGTLLTRTCYSTICNRSEDGDRERDATSGHFGERAVRADSGGVRRPVEGDGEWSEW